MDKFAEGYEESTSQDVPLLTVVYKPEMSVCVTVYKKRSCRHFFVRWRVEHDKVVNSARNSNEDRVGWTSPALNVNVDEVWKGFGEICSEHRKTLWPMSLGQIWEVDSCSRTSG